MRFGVGCVAAGKSGRQVPRECALFTPFLSKIVKLARAFGGEAEATNGAPAPLAATL